MKLENNKNIWSFPRKVFAIFLVFFVILYGQYAYIALFPNLYGINMEAFAANRNTVKTTLYAKRGSIYDNQGNLLALNITSYTVIAYLSASRTGNSSVPLHVVDIKNTAEALAPVLNMTVDYIEGLLNTKAYQVELGPNGRGITELKKEEIIDLNLPGISFIEEQKRYYPNGDFASYVLGYAKSYDDGSIVGELGVEAKYDNLLSGTDGYLEYQKDRFGYKIPYTKEIRIDAINGNNIYLTIDSSIQRFTEEAVKENSEQYNPEWMMLTVMDAKTGDILGTSSTPSFDPNILNITNYENPLVSYVYEPGSTMKIYTYMCTMEKGTYVGSDTYSSGQITIGNDKIYDWNRKGWGRISYDLGFEYSSNVAVSNLMQSYINKEDLKACLIRYGFGAKTDIELTREFAGSLDFNYPIEVATAAFGQGISTTAIQHLQALTIIANDGKMVKPHIVDRIVDPNTDEIIYESEYEVSDQIVSGDVVEQVKQLMYNTVNNKSSNTTGKYYAIEGFDIVGKTGTAQIYDSKTGSYLTSTNDYIYSFAGMYPKEDPKIIIYAAMQKPSYGASNGLIKATKSVMTDIAKYKNMFTEQENISISSITLSSYINKDITEVATSLEEKGLTVVVIGDGSKIINQYPLAKKEVLPGEKIYLKTNGVVIKMPSMITWTQKDLKTYFDLVSLKYTTTGYGYVISQNIIEDTIMTSESENTFILENKYKIDDNLED